MYRNRLPAAWLAGMILEGLFELVYEKGPLFAQPDQFCVPADCAQVQSTWQPGFPIFRGPDSEFLTNRRKGRPITTQFYGTRNNARPSDLTH